LSEKYPSTTLEFMLLWFKRLRNGLLPWLRLRSYLDLVQNATHLSRNPCSNADRIQNLKHGSYFFHRWICRSINLLPRGAIWPAERYFPTSVACG
jgi:hypothetical protein